MELQFDKEIDALLRKARDSERVGAGTASHLDADAMIAYAENALPQAPRRVYTEHLADCDRCRKLLSQAMVMNEAAVVPDSAAVLAPPVVAAESWLSRLFRMPNLAVAMGALVVLFTGVLMVIVIQNRRSESNAAVSQMTNTEQRSLPSFNEAPAAAANAASANTATNTTAMPIMNSNASTANSMPSNPMSSGTGTGTVSTTSNANISSGFAAPPAAKPADTTMGSDKLDAAKPGTQPELAAAEPKSRNVGAPPPLPTGGAVAADEKKAEERQETERIAKTKELDDALRGRRDAPMPAAKSGPARTGPLQTQSNQILNNKDGEMAVTRKAGGKTFSNRNGAWYDTAYHGQATQNVRRGSAEFEKLDKGLRSIANEIRGTMVILWKQTAYRID